MQVIERKVEVETDVALSTWLLDGRRSGVTSATFLLVHGLASNSKLWDFTALELAVRGHLVAAVDLRGHGTSDKPDNGYGFPTLISDIFTVSDALGLQKPVLVGQSLGANLVLEAAWSSADCSRGIVCVDGGTIELSRSFPDWDDAKKVLAPPRLAGTPVDAMRSMMRSAHPNWPESGIESTMANLQVRSDGTVAARLSFDNHMRILRGLWEHKPSSRFSTLYVPALFAFAGAAGGPPGKRESASEAEALIPSAGVVWFEDSDHDIHAQYPVELADLMDRQVKEGFFPTDQAITAED